MWGRSPCGERGLKSIDTGGTAKYVESLPLRGAWIEIFKMFVAQIRNWSLPSRGAWIEIELGYWCYWCR